MVREGGVSSTNMLRLEGLLDATLDHEHSECGDRLAEVLHSELRLLRDLQATLRIQRQGVADDDVEEVDRSLYAVYHLLLALADVREKRRLLTRELGLSNDVPLGALEVELGARLTEPARDVILQLQTKALTLVREIKGNRQVLASALAENNAYAQALYGEPLQGPVYDAGARHVSSMRHGGALLNQQV